MPIVWANNTFTLVNQTGVMATNASISQSNSLIPAYNIGKYWTVNQIPSDPIKSTFSLSYYPNVGKEPNYDILNTIRGLTDDVLYSGTRIVIAGVTGFNCYLRSYELQSAPNNLVKANVSYESFTPLSGQVSNRAFASTSDWGDLTVMSSSGDWEDLTVMSSSGDWGNIEDPVLENFDKIPHGWTTYISSSGNRLIAPTYDFNYKFTADWQPTYLIGQKFPTQVNFMAGTEEMSFVRDSFTHIQFSGEEVTGSFITGDWLIELFNYQLISTWANSGALIFDVSGAKIIDTKLVVDLNNFVRTATSIRRHY